VTFTPTTFRCAIDYVGPSSLITLIESFPPYWRPFKVRYIVAPNEGHGFLNPDNRLVLYRSMEEFFATYLGGRVQKGPPPGVEARLKAMTVDVDTLKAPGDTSKSKAAT
jgi:hypothetical protein